MAPPNVEAKTAICVLFADTQRVNQVAHIADPGNRFHQAYHNVMLGPTSGQLIREVGVGEDAHNEYTPGPTEDVFKGGPARPADAPYKHTSWEAPGGVGHATGFAVKGTSGSLTWWQMERSWDSAGNPTELAWVEMDPQPVSDTDADVIAAIVLMVTPA